MARGAMAAFKCLAFFLLAASLPHLSLTGAQSSETTSQQEAGEDPSWVPRSAFEEQQVSLLEAISRAERAEVALRSLQTEVAEAELKASRAEDETRRVQIQLDSEISNVRQLQEQLSAEQQDAAARIAAAEAAVQDARAQAGVLEARHTSLLSQLTRKEKELEEAVKAAAAAASLEGFPALPMLSLEELHKAALQYFDSASGFVNVVAREAGEGRSHTLSRAAWSAYEFGSSNANKGYEIAKGSLSNGAKWVEAKLDEHFPEAKVTVAKYVSQVGPVFQQYQQPAQEWLVSTTEAVQRSHAKVEGELKTVITTFLLSNPSLKTWADPVYVQMLIYIMYASPVIALLYPLLALFSARSDAMQTTEKTTSKKKKNKKKAA